ncbi:MAG: Transcriptional regulator, Crp family [Hyphomicrobiales bacterium]|nr:Transcriptional regulator, Crp family [Hyphomicrobiales bacterium]
MSTPSFKNLLLSRLDAKELARITPSLEHIPLTAKKVLVEVNSPIEYVYFPEAGICSLLAVTRKAGPIEVGMMGLEGMTDMLIEVGDISYLRTIVQMAGSAWRMKAEDFACSLSHSQPFARLVLRYKEALAIQFAYSAFAHGTFTIEERLSRWILMRHDRAQCETFPIVHDFMAAMLAVRRSGVTSAIHTLEGYGAIKSTRGMITIRDRDKLLDYAGECYGVSERAYQRIMESKGPSKPASEGSRHLEPDAQTSIGRRI